MIWSRNKKPIGSSLTENSSVRSQRRSKPLVKKWVDRNKEKQILLLIIQEVIPIAILFSQVKVQSADQSETFLISGIPKEYDDLTDSIQLEWFLQDIDSDDTVQVHADAYLYGDGETVNATHAELCYFLDRIRLNPNFLESRCQSAGSSEFTFDWSPEELFDQQLC